MGAMLAGIQNPYHEGPRLDIVIDDLTAKFGNGPLVELAPEKLQFTASLLTVPRVAVGERDGREASGLQRGLIGGRRGHAEVKIFRCQIGFHVC